VTSTTPTSPPNRRWYVRALFILAVPCALLVGTVGPALTHEDEDELLGGTGSRRFSHTPRGPGHGADAQNMRLVGFNDLQARSAYQPIIHHQGTRWIAYIGHHGSLDPIFNPITGAAEPNGTSIVDVTDPRHPKYLHHIPGQACPGCQPHGAVEGGGAQMVRACEGSTLPKGVPGKTYLLRTLGTDGHEIWDVTNPSAPTFVTTIITGLKDTHKSWWECDTGIAYLVSDGRPEGWKVSRMTKVYDLSDPTMPHFIRNFGLPGQNPGTSVTPAPTNLHGPISLGPTGNRVYFGYGTGSDGVLQIVDRSKLLDVSGLPPQARTAPTDAQLLVPQVGRLDLFPVAGAHTTFPVLQVPVPRFDDDAVGAVRDFVVVTNEAAGNQCTSPRQLVYMVDVTTEAKPFSVANFQVAEEPGHFCDRGGRFGSHSSNENFTPIYYRRITFHSWFNAGVRALDIRDPFRPKQIGFFIPATTAHTDERCVTIKNVETCKTAIQTNNVEVDDRGFIYIVDRANTGLHVLELTGEAREIANIP
jgi:hypothetical protein